MLATSETHRVRIDMTLIDDRILEIIREKADPSTRMVSLTLDEIRLLVKPGVGCHRNTVWLATNRLEAAGKIIKHVGRRRDGIIFEVVDDFC